MRLSPLLILTCGFAAPCFAADSPAPEQPAVPLKIHVDSDQILAHIAPDFIGLGYETSAVAQAGYFDVKNETLRQLYHHLSPHGMIRIGGIISDHTQYQPEGVLSVQTQKGTTIINKASLVELGEFAKATGWTVMWGLNLGTGAKDEAAQQAMAANEALRPQLHSFEIGNEVDDLKRFTHSFDSYHAAYKEYQATVRGALPEAKFSGPDTTGGGAISWVESFAATESADCRLLTSHYYRGGAGDPRSTMERMLAHDEGLDQQLEKLRSISHSCGVPYRINETNSFYGGGKAGVSDTFASALWCLDYMYVLASHECAGVNIETDVNQLGFISHYSPIVHDAAGHCTVRPEYYGMLAFAMSGKGDLVKIAMDKPELNFSAYATKDEAGLLVTLINKESGRDAIIALETPASFTRCEVVRLQAANLESHDHVTLGDKEVSNDGWWEPGEGEKLTPEQGVAQVKVPHASAALVRFDF